jgi:hypothetical protein
MGIATMLHDHGSTPLAPSSQESCCRSTIEQYQGHWHLLQLHIVFLIESSTPSMTVLQQQKHDTYPQSKDNLLQEGQSVFGNLSSKWGFFLFSFFLPHPGCFWLFRVWYPTLLQMSAKGPLNLPFLKGYNKSAVHTKRWSKVRFGLFESNSDQPLEDCEFVRIKPRNLCSRM